MNKPDRINVYRFHGYAAVTFCNKSLGLTMYLDKETANKLSVELLLLSKDIDEVGFVDSIYSTQVITQEN